MINNGKVYHSTRAALQDIVQDGQTLAVGGFGLCGIPELLIQSLRDTEVKDLTCIRALLHEPICKGFFSDIIFK